MSLRKRNGRWHIRFQLDHRIWTVSTGLPATKQNRAAAEKREVEARQLVMDGQNPKRRLVVKPFNEAASDFLEWAEGEYIQHPATAHRLRTSFAKLRLFFGSTLVSLIGPGNLENFKSWRRKDRRAEVTIRHDLHAASKFFEYGKKQGWASQNPVREVTLPSDRDSNRQHVLTAAEEALYFNAATGDLHDVGRLILLQGARPEELVELRSEDVDLEKRTLTIRKGKTRAARRTLRLTSESLHILAPRAARGGSQWVFPSRRCPGQHIGRLNTQHDDLLFKHNHDMVGDQRERPEHDASWGDRQVVRWHHRWWIEKPKEKQIHFRLYDLRQHADSRIMPNSFQIHRLEGLGLCFDSA